MHYVYFYLFSLMIYMFLGFLGFILCEGCVGRLNIMWLSLNSRHIYHIWIFFYWFAKHEFKTKHYLYSKPVPHTIFTISINGFLVFKLFRPKRYGEIYDYSFLSKPIHEIKPIKYITKSNPFFMPNPLLPSQSKLSSFFIQMTAIICNSHFLVLFPSDMVTKE